MVFGYWSGLGLKLGLEFDLGICVMITCYWIGLLVTDYGYFNGLGLKLVIGLGLGLWLGLALGLGLC